MLSETLSETLSESLKFEEKKKTRKKCVPGRTRSAYAEGAGKMPRPQVDYSSVHPSIASPRSQATRDRIVYGFTLNCQLLDWLPAVFGFWSSWLPDWSLAPVLTVAT